MPLYQRYNVHRIYVTTANSVITYISLLTTLIAKIVTTAMMITIVTRVIKVLKDYNCYKRPKSHTSVRVTMTSHFLRTTWAITGLITIMESNNYDRSRQSSRTQ